MSTIDENNIDNIQTDLEKRILLFAQVMAKDIESYFNTNIYKSEIINLHTHKDKGLPIWMGLSAPPINEYKHVYLIIVSFEIDEEDFVVTKSGKSSSYDTWSVQNYVSDGLSGDEVFVGGAYIIGEKKYRWCKWYWFE